MGRASYGLSFDTYTRVERTSHLRADVALFVGFIAPRRQGLPRPDEEAQLREWIARRGFKARVDALTKAASTWSVATLEHVPIPVEDWTTFERLFAWEARTVDPLNPVATYLGAAVRAFFAQGGRKAYIVRAGEPWKKVAVDSNDKNAIAAAEAERRIRRDALLPSRAIEGWPVPTPLEPATWRGMTHLFGLDDVSFVLLPDLPDIYDATPAWTIEPGPAIPEAFVECSERLEAPADTLPSRVPPPACDGDTLELWADDVRAVRMFLQQHYRMAQLIVAVPLILEKDAGGRARISARSPFAGRDALFGRLASAFVQLVAPWLKTAGAIRIAADLEPPDGTVAGLLARNALMQGTFRSAAGTPVSFVYDLAPAFGRAALFAPIVDADTNQPTLHLLQRVTIVGRVPGGIKLLSDVTTSRDPAYRSAGASRLVGAVLRAARAIGEDLCFEPSGELLWTRVRHHFRALLTQLWQAGALRGRTADEAFQVRCDRATMTQADLDAGRVVVDVQMEVAVAIESVRVTLVLSEGGRATLLAGGAA